MQSSSLFEVRFRALSEDIEQINRRCKIIYKCRLHRYNKSELVISINFNFNGKLSYDSLDSETMVIIVLFEVVVQEYRKRI